MEEKCLRENKVLEDGDLIENLLKRKCDQNYFLGVNWKKKIFLMCSSVLIVKSEQIEFWSTTVPRVMSFHVFSFIILFEVVLL